MSPKMGASSNIGQIYAHTLHTNAKNYLNTQEDTSFLSIRLVFYQPLLTAGRLKDNIALFNNCTA